VWRRLVGSAYPASAGIGVTRLWDAEALVELQGIAVLPDEG
jgi:enamine deaminase RidA (YjgF/YER057c/UK114 family)